MTIQKSSVALPSETTVIDLNMLKTLKRFLINCTNCYLIYLGAHNFTKYNNTELVEDFLMFEFEEVRVSNIQTRQGYDKIQDIQVRESIKHMEKTLFQNSSHLNNIQLLMFHERERIEKFIKNDPEDWKWINKDVPNFRLYLKKVDSAVEFDNDSEDNYKFIRSTTRKNKNSKIYYVVFIDFDNYYILFYVTPPPSIFQYFKKPFEQTFKKSLNIKLSVLDNDVFKARSNLVIVHVHNVPDLSPTEKIPE